MVDNFRYVKGILYNKMINSIAYRFIILKGGFVRYSEKCGFVTGKNKFFNKMMVISNWTYLCYIK